MGMTMVEKILAKTSGKRRVAAGDVVEPRGGGALQLGERLGVGLEADHLEVAAGRLPVREDSAPRADVDQDERTLGVVSVEPVAEERVDAHRSTRRSIQ